MKATGIQLSADVAQVVAHYPSKKDVEKEKEKEREREREKNGQIDYFSDIPFLDYIDDNNLDDEDGDGDDDDDDDDDDNYSRGERKGKKEGREDKAKKDAEVKVEGERYRDRNRGRRKMIRMNSTEQDREYRNRNVERETDQASFSSHCSSGRNSVNSSAKLSSTSNMSPSSSFNNSVSSSRQSSARKRRTSEGSQVCAAVIGLQVSKAMQDLKLLNQTGDSIQKRVDCRSSSAGGESRFDLQADAQVRLGSVIGSDGESKNGSTSHTPKNFGFAVEPLSLFPSDEQNIKTLPESGAESLIYLMSQSSGFTVKNKFVSEEQLKELLDSSLMEHSLHYLT